MFPALTVPNNFFPESQNPILKSNAVLWAGATERPAIIEALCKIESNLSDYLYIPILALIIYILIKINWHSLISILNNKIIVATGILIFLYTITPVMAMVDSFIRGFVGSSIN